MSLRFTDPRKVTKSVYNILRAEACAFLDECAIDVPGLAEKTEPGDGDAYLRVSALFHLRRLFRLTETEAVHVLDDWCNARQGKELRWHTH